MNSQVILTDLKNGTILFDGQADLVRQKKQLQIVMQSHSLNSVWKIMPKGVVIENKEEALSVLSLFESGKGRVRIFSEFGELEGQLSDVRIRRDGHMIQVSYSIASEESFSFALRCDDFCFSSSED